MKTTVIIVQTLVISRLDYCKSLIGGLSATLTKRLQRVHNAAARVIAKAGISRSFSSKSIGFRSNYA